MNKNNLKLLINKIKEFKIQKKYFHNTLNLLNEVDKYVNELMKLSKKIVTYPEIRELLSNIVEINPLYETHLLDNINNVSYKFNENVIIPNISPYQIPVELKDK